MADSSTSSIETRFVHNVFLSFRGEDIRKSFVDHLYAALQLQGIATFKDDREMKQGQRIDDQLIKAIEHSKISIIVFSKNYAYSSWCLNELVKIMECRKTTNQTVYPVFYDVYPTEVRNQSGEFGKAFAAKHDHEEAGKWREALKEAGKLSGRVLKDTADGHEVPFIKIIVEEVYLELRPINVYTDQRIVGMERRIRKCLPLLETDIDDVRMICIKGIVGGGKTTLAKAVFNQISTQFDCRSFVEDVSKVSKAQPLGLKSLQQQVLLDVLNKNIIVTSVDNGKIQLKNTLCGRKALIVLDDVDHRDQLEALAGAPNWFGPGSRIIVTTTDEQVLIEHGVNLFHDVDLLSNEEAICLFERYAFVNGFPNEEYEKLSLEVVGYAAGLPLMIKNLGSALCGKEVLEWEDQLEGIKESAFEETFGILELSYNGLKANVKDIFLDIACFLKCSPKIDAVRILESCGFEAIYGLEVLKQRSLITISDDQRLGMHDLVQEMGRYIVRHLHPRNPEKHSRLWLHDEIEDILANNLGTDETRAIAVDDNDVKSRSEIVTNGFVNMRNLRFLRVVSEYEADNSRRDERSGHVGQNLPDALQYLSWQLYPHWCLPRTFRTNKLVTLEMSDCRMKQLWERNEGKALTNLKFLVLNHSKLETLDLTSATKLEKLDLEGCADLARLHMPVEGLKELVYLNLSYCKKISSFSFIKRLELLEVLDLTHLLLEEFPDIIPRHCKNALRELRFTHNRIEELPPSIGNLHKLVYLDLNSCRKLRSLHKDIGCLKSLEKLNLSKTGIRDLPNSICKLTSLKTLKLSSCQYLKTLPRDLGQLECLQNLILKKCKQVKDIPDSICRLRLEYLCLSGCDQLATLPNELGRAGGLAVLNIKGTPITRHIPRRITLLQGLKIIGAKSVLQSRGLASKRKFDHI